MANKWVYTFKEGNMTMRNLLGGNHRVSQSLQRLVHSTTRMDVRSMMRLWLRLWKV